MVTTYKSLYDSVYSKIKDYDFIQLAEEITDEILHDYIRPAIVEFEDCDQDLSDRDESAQQFNIDLSDLLITHKQNFLQSFERCS